MDRGILAHKLWNYTHFWDFILCFIYYIQCIDNHMGTIITNTHHFWSTVWET